MLGWELPPHNSGGLGVACFQMCKSLSSKPLDLEFILPYEAQHNHGFMKTTSAVPVDVTEIIADGTAYDSYKYVYSNGTEQNYDIFARQAIFEKAISEMADDLEFDIVHAHDWLTFRAAMQLKARTGRPIILHVHSVESDRAGGNSGNPLVREIEGTAFMMADHIIAVSEHTKRVICKDYGIPADCISVVHNSIDAAEVPTELSGDNSYAYLETLKRQGYKVVTNVGRMTIQKGLVGFMHAAKIVVDHRPKTMFLLVGAGEQYEELIELSAELEIAKNVIFAGFQRGKAWRDAFAVADLFVMPSISEPFGLTPLESTLFGTPSLISKQSGIAEVLKNCLKVDFWDEREIANQIIAAVDNEPLRATLLEGADREVRGMSWQKASDQIHAIYERHIGVHRKAAIV